MAKSNRRVFGVVAAVGVALGAGGCKTCAGDGALGALLGAGAGYAIGGKKHREGGAAIGALAGFLIGYELCGRAARAEEVRAAEAKFAAERDARLRDVERRNREIEASNAALQREVDDLRRSRGASAAEVRVAQERLDAAPKPVTMVAVPTDRGDGVILVDAKTGQAPANAQGQVPVLEKAAVTQRQEELGVFLM